MSGKETPLQAVKRLYGSKDKLVDSIASVLKDADEDTVEATERLLRASNARLLRLAGVAKSVKDRFGGSKDKLVAGVSGALGRAKDSDYVAKLKSYSPARLLDMLGAAEKKTKASKNA